MSHPINGGYINGGYDVEQETISFRISSHDEASGRFSGTLTEYKPKLPTATQDIKGGFKFNRDTSSTSFSFETPTDNWDLQSPYLESPNQFAIMNATRTPKDQSQPPQKLVFHKAGPRSRT